MIFVVKNKFTEKKYEAIQYSQENFQKCKDFISEHMDVSITSIMPKMRVYGLKSYKDITEINPTDFIIRTITEGNPLYNVVSKDIMENNFEIVEQSQMSVGAAMVRKMIEAYEKSLQED